MLCSGSTGFGEEFARSIQGDPLKGPAEEINEAADQAIGRYAFIAGARQVAGGASYGGHLANWFEATTTRYRCLISHAGLVNLESLLGKGEFWFEGFPLKWVGGTGSPVRAVAEIAT